MKLVPVLFKGTSILLDDSSLLWVDDTGSSHDDGATFTRCRLGKKGHIKLRTTRNPPWKGQGSHRTVTYTLSNWNVSNKHAGILFILAGIY